MLKFSPPSIVVESLEETPIVSIIKFQNVSPKFLKIKIENGLSKNVVAEFTSGDKGFKQVAPGVAVDVRVQICIEEDAHEGVHFILNGTTTEIFPVVFQRPKPSLRIVSNADFGTLSLNGEVFEKWVSIVNDGNKDTTFEIQSQDVHDDRVRISQPTGFIGHTSSKVNEISFCVEFFANAVGICHETVRIIANNEVQSELEIKANVVPQSLTVIDPITESEVSHIDMGCIYYGTEREFKEVIFNNRMSETMYVVTPVSHSVWIYTENGREQCNLYTDAADVVIPNPVDGTLSPNEKRVCNFTFQPYFPADDDNITNLPYQGRRDFTAEFRIECITDKLLSHSITFSGSAIVPSFRITKKSIRFGECLVGDQEENNFTIENVSNQLPLTYEIESLAHFKFTPKRGIILTDDTVNINIQFVPKQPGTLKRKFKIKLGHETASVEIPIEGVGIAGRREEMTLRATQRAKSGFNKPIKISDKHVPKSAPLDCGHRQQSIFAKTNMRKATARLRPLTRARIERNDESRRQSTLTTGRSAKSSFAVNHASLSMVRESKSPTMTAVSHVNDPIKNFSSMSLASAMSVASSTKKQAARKPSSRLSSEGDVDSVGVESSSLRSVLATSTSLRPRDLQMLQFEPDGALDFGNMCIDSVGKRIITIKNPLKTPVIIEAACHRAEFSVSVSSYMVEPQSSTEISIVLSKISEEAPLILQSHVSVIVNKVHCLKIPVHARIVPFSITLSSDRINLSCGYCVKASRPCSYVTVSNSFGRECFYYWEVYETLKGDKKRSVLQDGAFQVVPAQGSLGAHADTQVQVNLYPDKYTVGSQYEIQLVLEGSSDVKTIKCQANFDHSKCRFMESRTVFGTISQSSSNSRVAVLTNEGRVDAYFTVKNVHSRFGLSDISISPSSGMVPARSMLELQITCKASRLGKLDANIVLDVKDQKPLSHIISGQVVPIKLNIDRDQFDFGHMLLGQTRTLPFEITNNSGCEVEVSFDYGSLVGFSTHTEVFGGVDTEVNIVPVPTGVTITLYLQLIAQEVCSFGSNITIAANSIKVASISVSGTVLAASVSVLPRSIDFGSLVLGDEVSKILSLKHSGSSETRLLLDCTALMDAGISLHHDMLVKYDVGTHGVPALMPSSRAITPTTSKMNSARERARQLQSREASLASRTGKRIAARSAYSSRQTSVNEDGTKGNISVLKRVAAKDFDEENEDEREDDEKDEKGGKYGIPTDSLYFIDLNNELGADIVVRLDTNAPFGRINATLPVYLSTDDSEPFLTVQIKAKELAAELQVSNDAFFLGCLPVRNEKILEFTIKSIGFVEETEIDYTLEGKGDGREVNDYAMTIIFPKGKTLRPYLELPVEVHIYSESSTDFDQNLVLFDSTEHSCAVRIAGMVDSTIFSKIVNVPFESKEFGVMTNGLKRFFQIYGLSSAFYLTIPSSFTQKCGWLLADIISNLSYVKIQNLPLTRPETLTLEQQLGLMEIILQFLIARGALLQEVVAEDLLIAGPRQKRAWVLVLAQVARVLVLGQLPVRIGRAPRQSMVGNGFVTHPHEKLVHVMDWANHSVLSRGEKALSKGINNFEDDFRDGLVFADLILAHVPELEEMLGNAMFPQCDNETKLYHNAISVVRALKHLKIYLNIDVQDIVEPSEPFITIVIVQLAVMLPKFLCDSKEIKSTGSLASNVSVPVVFANPDPARVLTFHILSFGSNQFKIPDKLRVPPKSSETIHCKVNSNVSGSHVCNLIFVAYYGGHTVPIVKRHTLEVDILRKPSSVALEMETKCYDQQTRLLLVNKPFRSSKTCTVMTTETSASGDVLCPHYPSFWVDDETIDFTSNNTSEMTVHFLPTRLGQHYFNIVLRDDITGFERCYGVIGMAQTPDPLQTISWTSQLQKETKLSVKVPFTNDARRAALSKISLTTETLRNLTVAPRVISGSTLTRSDHVTLSVKIVGCAHVTGPDNITLYPPPTITATTRVSPMMQKHVSTLSVIDEQEHSSKLELNFNPIAAGSYSFDVHLIGPEDVRVYRMHGDVGESLEVEAFTETEVGTSSSVPLALCNPCDAMHIFEISIVGDSNCFFCSDSITIEGNGQDTLMLKYSPTTVGTNECTVNAKDTFTDVTSFFHIRARAHPEVDRTKPTTASRSRSAISATSNKPIMVECEVWNSKEFTLRLKNESREPATFYLSFESPNMLGEELVYDEEIVVGPLGFELISCEYLPLRDGMFSGMLNVDDGENPIHSIKLEFIANPPMPLTLPSVGVIMNSSASVDIPVTNPSVLPLCVTVDENCIDDTFTFEPLKLNLEGNATAVFKLMMSPQRRMAHSIGDPNEQVTLSKDIVIHGDYGIRWNYLLPVVIFPEGIAQPERNGEMKPPHVVGGKCNEEDLFEIEISNSGDTPREYTIFLEQDESRKAKAEFMLLKSKVRVKGNQSAGLPMCFLPHVVSKHFGTVTARPTDTSLPDKKWELVGLAQPSKSDNSALLKCITDTPVTRTFIVTLHDIDPDCDISKLHVNLDGFDSFTTAECSILDIYNEVVKVACEFEADLASKTIGTIEVYHEDGFFWERRLTVVSHAPLVDSIELNAQSISGRTLGMVTFSGDITEDGTYSVFFIDEKVCFGIVEDEPHRKPHVKGQPLKVGIYFEAQKSKGNTSTELVVRFESGKEYAVQIQGIQPGL
eukprot:m.2571 g.2571  ORF g.2571 m.2571 type:complete len:2661 (+) comp1841_c0_seq1:140-8122(+)